MPRRARTLHPDPYCPADLRTRVGAICMARTPSGLDRARRGTHLCSGLLDRFPPRTYTVLHFEGADGLQGAPARRTGVLRSEEHTSELQSRSDLVCRLLLEKKKCSSEEIQDWITLFRSDGRLCGPPPRLRRCRFEIRS